jgi:hypothetical protein
MKTKRIFTSLRGDAHAYTRSDAPWSIDVAEEVYAGLSKQSRGRWRLFHYISSGGMKVFGRTLAQDERSRRQTRFLVFSGIVFALWFLMRMI